MSKHSQKASKLIKLDFSITDYNVYDCQECKCVFHSVEEFALHFCSSKNFNECFGCGKCFPTLSLLVLHKCSNKVSYECDMCKEIFYDVYELVLHKCMVNIPLMCYDCMKIFPEISALALHKCTYHSSANSNDLPYSDESLPLNPLIKSANAGFSIYNKTALEPLVYESSKVAFNSIAESAKISSNICDKSVLDYWKPVIKEPVPVPLFLHPLKKGIKSGSNVCDKSVISNFKPSVPELSSVSLNHQTSYNICDKPVICNPKPLIHKFSSLDYQTNILDKSVTSNWKPSVLKPLSMSLYHQTSSNIYVKTDIDNMKPFVCKPLSMSLNYLIQNKKMNANAGDNSALVNAIPLKNKSLRVPLKTFISKQSRLRVCNKSGFGNLSLRKALLVPLNSLKKGAEMKSSIYDNRKLLLPTLAKNMFSESDKTYSNNGSLNINKNIRETNHKCGICYHVFSSAQKLLSHKKLHSVSQISSLHTNASDFLSDNARDEQKSSKIFYKKYKCHQCGKVYYTQNAFNQHRSLACHPNLHHRKQRTNTLRFLLPKNYFVKSSKIENDAYDNHEMLSNVIPIDEVRCKCYLCVKTCSKQGVVAANKHVSEEQYKCDICQKLFSCNRHLYNHKQLHKVSKLSMIKNSQQIGTKNDINASDNPMPFKRKLTKVFKCSECKRTFSRQGALNLHRRTHRVQHKCHICHKRFLCSQDLYDHNQLHRTSEQLTIKNTNTSPHTYNDLNSLVHKPCNVYKCSKCKKKFRGQDALNLHKCTHRKHHECDICHKLFSSHEGLFNHHKQLHGSLFKCAMCIETFSTQKTYSAHMLTH